MTDRTPLARTFLLSPAFCGGKRAQVLLREAASFPLARRVASSDGAAIGEVFSFLSGLYFRGKLAYAREFSGGETAKAPKIITPTRGLVPADAIVTREDLMEFALVDISQHDERFRSPFERDAAILASLVDGDIVLLGSVATGKYVDCLIDLLGERLVFPASFVGRGDMSRGGLLLRCVREGRELDYVPVVGAVRHGKRPPKLSRLS
jgi:hypothetical protein